MSSMSRSTRSVLPSPGRASPARRGPARCQEKSSAPRERRFRLRIALELGQRVAEVEPQVRRLNRSCGPRIARLQQQRHGLRVSLLVILDQAAHVHRQRKLRIGLRGERGLPLRFRIILPGERDLRQRFRARWPATSLSRAPRAASPRRAAQARSAPMPRRAARWLVGLQPHDVLIRAQRFGIAAQLREHARRTAATHRSSPGCLRAPRPAHPRRRRTRGHRGDRPPPDTSGARVPCLWDPAASEPGWVGDEDCVPT